jgi:Domain of unknown function (DUF4838)/Glycosyl hydrolase family 67 N-terminus
VSPASTLGLGATALIGFAASAGAGDLVVARHGKSPYQIVVPEVRNSAIDYAAAELQRLLHDVSGAELPVVTEGRSRRRPAFLLGPSSRATRAGLVGRARKLGPDGVLIKMVGKDLVLLGGGDRGQLYSVYVLLERFLGCRFLAADCTLTPHRDVLALAPIDYSYTPQFVYREELYYDCANWDFAARLRLNGSNIYQCQGRPMSDSGERIPGFLICPFVHTTTGIVSADKYFAAHPEYFGLVNGQRHVGGVGSQLCFANPDVLRICTDWVLKWLSEHPEVTSVDVSQNDAYPGSSGACECEACTAIVKEEGAQQGPILRFVNSIAAEVARKYPGKFVDTLAYDYTIRRPKLTTPLDNVIIRLCHYACYFHGIADEPLSENYRAAIDEWRPVARNLFIWHYGTNFWHYLAPNPNLASLASDISYYAAHGVNGVMVQGNLQSTGGELCDLRHYLIAQLLWDPSQDPMVLRTEFCQGYYGPAASEVLEFLALMDRLAETTKLHIPTNGWNPPDIATRDFVASALAVLDRALVKCGDPVHSNRIDRLMLPLWYVQLGWPDQYGVSNEEGRALLARFANVLRANGITTISEGPPNAEDFIARMESVFGPLG